MIGNPHFDQVVASAPLTADPVQMGWPVVKSLLQDAQVDPSTLVAATWCSFGEMNIEALVDSVALTMVFPWGVLSTAGKASMMGKKPKYKRLDFAQVQRWGDAEYEDERGLGKFCIEFAGPGGVLLGRLQWPWRAKRFRDPREQIMAAASERDRISAAISQLLS